MLRDGAVLCYPTDTGYGIGCDIFNQKAIKRIYQIKKRLKHKPFSFMCSSLKEASLYAGISNMAYRLMKKNLPGPYTFVLQGTKIVPKLMITKQKTVGIRVPNNNICLALIQTLGQPILNTSALISKEDPPVMDAYDVQDRWEKLVDAIIDGGPVYPNPSSVISLLNDCPEVLRHGKGAVSQFI